MSILENNSLQLQELKKKESRFVSGHQLCPGCELPAILRIILRATVAELVVVNATGCLQAGTAVFPRTSWKTNWLHLGRDNAASVMSGMEMIYRQYKTKGKFSDKKEIQFLIIAGDGATYDSGLGALIAAIERNHDFVYLCYDNQVSAHAGGLKTSATPLGAATLNTPDDKNLSGNLQYRRNRTGIIRTGNLKYFAQSAAWHWQDLYIKAKKAFEKEGPAFLNVMSGCPRYWGFAPEKTIKVSRGASDSCFWPLWQSDDEGGVQVTYYPEEKRPLADWLVLQKRFSHLFQPENKWIIDKMQQDVDNEWELLKNTAKNTEGN